MQGFTPLPALLGGVLIGLSASVLLLGNGRIAGISGMAAGLVLPGTNDRMERLLFLLGMLGGGALLLALRPESFPGANEISVPLAVAAGLLVGFGTRLGNGCTSGHGVCGLSRLSARSLAATLTFMATGALTAVVVRKLGGGAP
ncbi:YeeE/YedE thiosulfate transporter family protein [Polyangium sp. y55x31]|uniref:YeeE/YedE family protein n=1 Tax=Polyangium sp. y55x31 TaxID=3042688 RepID=UPI0024830ED4|nr:YeeE/YedE thiosulfate transporter family protein [Polyangium sp. y55x31]MDI1475699.1 YeeE/YedE thiosulfate transporter family protein [Polyangium sp. y55x31]